MKFTDENVKKIRQFVDIKNRGYYANGTEVTNVYNEVLEKNVPPTNCGSCIRARISELEGALASFERMLKKQQEKTTEALKESEVNNIKEEENNDAEEAKKAIMRERMAKARAARKNKTN